MMHHFEQNKKMRNAQEILAMYYHKSGNFNYHVLDVYHGTSAFAIPDIMSRGLTPTLGAGCDALEAQFGEEVAEQPRRK